MTEPLRGALAEIGERAPVAHVPHDTWTRARRARRRELVGSVAALALLVAGSAGVVGSLRHDPAPVAAGGASDRLSDGAIPSQVYAVPDRLRNPTNDAGWSGPVESDLAIGRGSVAWWSEPGPPAVITAADGGYHLLALPGFLGGTIDGGGLGAGLALSPDGTSLAYGWSGPAPANANQAMPSGVRVVDLQTGSVRTLALHGGKGVLVTQVSWSPDSRWIAWTGQTAVSWGASSMRFHGEVQGRIAPGATTSDPLPSSLDAGGLLAISDDGLAAVLGSSPRKVDGVFQTPLNLVPVRGRTVTRAVGTPTPVTIGNDPARLAFSPDGRLLSLATTSPGQFASVLRVSDGRLLAHRFPNGLYPEGATVAPLGWLDDTHLVSAVTPHSGDTAGEHQLVMMTPTVGRHSTYHIVGRTDGSLPVATTVAVDLMTLDKLTVDFPAPTWPWPTEKKIAVGLAAGLGAAGMAWLVLTLVRRRRLLAR